MPAQSETARVRRPSGELHATIIRADGTVLLKSTEALRWFLGDEVRVGAMPSYAAEVASNGTSFGTSPVYDLLGRSYRVGFRFKM